jgi:predicted dithiol-disulfide oxidoreductase (DUF899 family)
LIVFLAHRFLPPRRSDEWLTGHKQNLKTEKFTRVCDVVAAERRTLPRVKVEQEHVFDPPDVEKTLAELSDGRAN